MEKEKILSEMKSKLGKTGLSDRTLEEYVNVNLPAEGVEPDDAYYARHLSVLKTIDGQVSHETATKVEEFKKNYKPEANPTNPTNPTNPSDTESALAKQVAAQQKALDEMKAQFDKQASAASQKELLEKVRAGLKAKGATDEYVLGATLLKAGELDGKKSVDELVEALASAYDKEFTACRGDGGKPRTSQEGTVEATKAALAALKKKHQANGDLPADKA